MRTRFVLPLSSILILAACAKPSGRTGEAVSEVVTVRFEIEMAAEIAEGRFAPSRDRVGVRGSVEPLSWAESLLAEDPDGDSVYTLEIEIPAGSEPGRYKFKIEAANPQTGWEDGRDRLIPREGGSQVLERSFNAPGQEPEAGLTGDIRHHPAVVSNHLDAPRDVWVYLPAEYQDSSRQYPVLYLQDGANVFDAPASGFEWRADEAAESLIASGEIEPVIIVAVGATSARIDEYTHARPVWRHEFRRLGEANSGWSGVYQVDGDPDMRLELVAEGDSVRALLPQQAEWNATLQMSPDSLAIPGAGIQLVATAREGGSIVAVTATRPDRGGGGDAYGRFLITELKPFIDATYRTDPGRSAVGGASLGGLIATYLGVLYPALFEGVLAVSPSVWWDDMSILDVVENASSLSSRIWIDVGTEESDGMVQGARALERAAEAHRGSVVKLVIAKGASHNELAWAARFPDMLRFLYGK